MARGSGLPEGGVRNQRLALAARCNWSVVAWPRHREELEVQVCVLTHSTLVSCRCNTPNVNAAPHLRLRCLPLPERPTSLRSALAHAAPWEPAPHGNQRLGMRRRSCSCACSPSGGRPPPRHTCLFSQNAAFNGLTKAAGGVRRRGTACLLSRLPLPHPQPCKEPAFVSGTFPPVVLMQTVLSLVPFGSLVCSLDSVGSSHLSFQRCELGQPV